MLPEQEEGASGPVCERCGQLCEPLELNECPVCRKKFCLYCSHRVASRNYCSRACGDIFFFGGDEEPDDNPVEE